MSARLSPRTMSPNHTMFAMPQSVRRLLTSLAVAAIAGSASHAGAQSADYRCVDENGRPQYTNVKTETDGRRCTVVTREVSVVDPGNRVTPPVPPVGGAAATPTAPTQPRPATQPPAQSASPGGFPRVDPQTQRSRDDSRRKILEDELSAEQRSLTKAKTDLTEQESTRMGGEKNYQRLLDRVKPDQDSVDRHERNIAALQRELGNLR